MKIMNPFSFWFKYSIIFWKLEKVSKSRMSANDICREKYTSYYIRHIVSGKTLDYNGWGSELKQYAIYQVNGKYEEFQKCINEELNK